MKRSKHSYPKPVAMLMVPTHTHTETYLDEETATCATCGDDFPAGRYDLGYNTCLACGDFQARQVRYCTAPINKSNYMLITNRETLAQLNPKRTT